MTSADLYVRLSVDHPEATSIERQQAECRAWCATQSLTVRHVHVDRGVSGFDLTARRDGFDAALEAVTSGVVSTLVVWKLDRLSRRGIGQVGQLLDRFEAVGGRLVSVVDGLDTARPHTRMIIALLSEFARAESETMGVRIRSAKSAQRAQGLWLSGKPPFGYCIAPDRRLMRVEPAATQMHEVFAQLAGGHSLYRVCRELNAAGARNSRGGLWRDSALSEAIRTPAYAGLTPARHVNAEGRHAAGVPHVYRNPDTGDVVSCLTEGEQPIVTRAEQLAAFETLRSRLHRYGPLVLPRRYPYALLLRGLGRCAACRRPLITNNGYRCRPVDRAGAVVCSTPTNASVTAVDPRVTAAWRQLVHDPDPAQDGLRLAVARLWGLWHADPERDWHGLTARAADLRARRDDADEARYVHGLLNDERHRLVTSKLDERIQSVEAEMCAATPAADTAQLQDGAFVDKRWAASSADRQRTLLRLAWTEIRIAKAGLRGGHFDPDRISYVRNLTPLSQIGEPLAS